MTFLQELEIVSQNLMETYLSLGKSSPGAAQYNDDGVFGCLSSIPHAASNFVFGIRPSQEAVKRLRQISDVKPYLNIYLLPSLERPTAEEMLVRAGFERVNTLHFMSCDQAGLASVDFLEHKTFQDRFDFAMGMARQFFPTAPEEFCEGLASVTATDNRCQLLSVVRARGQVGGAMVSRSPGALGLYNVHVSARLRRNGIGSAMVQSLMARAHKENRLTTLQCHADLVQWYTTLGFKVLESVEVYRRPG